MKLYYTDPLAAAYMAREFGVSYLIDGSKIEWRDWPDWVDLKPHKDRKLSYIHADSHHIFQPMEGDKDEDGYVYSSGTKWWLWDGYDKRGNQHVFNKGFNSQTAKRQGKAFFMPEREETQKPTG